MSSQAHKKIKLTAKALGACVFETVYSSLRAFILLGYFQYCCHYVKPHHVPDICQLSYKYPLLAEFEVRTVNNTDRIFSARKINEFFQLGNETREFHWLLKIAACRSSTWTDVAEWKLHGLISLKKKFFSSGTYPKKQGLFSWKAFFVTDRDKQEEIVELRTRVFQGGNVAAFSQEQVNDETFK